MNNENVFHCAKIKCGILRLKEFHAFENNTGGCIIKCLLIDLIPLFNEYCTYPTPSSTYKDNMVQVPGGNCFIGFQFILVSWNLECGHSLLVACLHSIMKSFRVHSLPFVVGYFHLRFCNILTHVYPATD